jgi:peroxiredoxin
MAVVTNALNYAQIDTTTFDGVSLVVTLPAAFSDTCTKQCVPGILGNLKKIKDAGAKHVILVCSDQPFAIAEWVRYSQWGTADVTFASDFGCFQMREIVGRVSEEEGKKNLPRALGDLLRRAYVVFKDGKIAGKYIEPDALAFTLNVNELIAGITAQAAF